MKIIIANYRYFIAGGPEKYMFKFMDAVKEKGVEVIPFSINNPQNIDTPYSKYFAKPRADTIMFADTKRSIKNLCGMIRATVYNYDAEKRLRRLIRDEEPDALYILHEVNHLSPSIIRAAKKEGIRVVHRISDFFMLCARYDFLCKNDICESCIHGNYRKAIEYRCVKDSLSGTLLRVFAMKLYNWLKIFNEVDMYITPSSFTREKLIEGGISGEKIQHIPTFIDAAKIIPCYSNNRYFLFLGRIAHQKGTIYAILAMIYFKDTDYILKITGTLSDTKEDQILATIIRENQLEDRIIFTGFKHGKELDELIDYCTCVVCPAIWYENMPNTVLEAYAHGKPVVASFIGSLSEIIEDDKTGYLFEPKNVDDLVEKLRQFVTNNNLSSELGHNARIKCENEYSVDKHLEKVILCLNGKCKI